MFSIGKQSAGITPVEVSVNPSDQEMVSACMTVTPGYSEWCKEQIALGNAVADQILNRKDCNAPR